MQVVEFRGKRLDNGEWVYGNLVSDGKRYFIIYDNDITECTRYGERYIEASRYFEVDPETVGQYTGLRDKNSTKIYEGDIAKADIYGKEFAGLVQYSQGLGLYYLSGMARSDTELWICEEKEVIGNIHDSPELLEVE